MYNMFLKSQAKMKKNEKGFTLVELIIVVAILGILAAVGIARFAGLTDNARINSDLSMAATIASAAKAWQANQDSAVVGLPDPAGSAQSITLLQNEGYLEASTLAPQSESTGNVFELAASGSAFTVTSVGTGNAGAAATVTWYPKQGDRAAYKTALGI